MARGVNKVILIGNLGQDPDTKYMPSGSAVTNLRIATTEVFKNKDTGQSEERTEWHSVAMFGRLAEIAGEYLRKGSQVYVEGRLRTRKWQDKQGRVVAAELYDHQADPAETKNIAGDPGQAKVVEELSKKLMDGWQAAGPKA